MLTVKFKDITSRMEVGDYELIYGTEDSGHRGLYICEPKDGELKVVTAWGSYQDEFVVEGGKGLVDDPLARKLKDATKTALRHGKSLQTVSGLYAMLEEHKSTPYDPEIAFRQVPSEPWFYASHLAGALAGITAIAITSELLGASPIEQGFGDYALTTISGIVGLFGVSKILSKALEKPRSSRKERDMQESLQEVIAQEPRFQVPERTPYVAQELSQDEWEAKKEELHLEGKLD